MAALFAFPLLCMLFGLSSAAHTAPAPAAHTAPAPAADCSSLVANMVDCLSYVTVGGTAKKPEGTCCSGLKTVVKTDADCICQAFRNSAQLGVTIDVSKALTLPAACHVSAPSLSTCALSPSAGAAPALSPLAMSPSSVAGAPTTGIAGIDDGAPAPAVGSSDASMVSRSIESVVLMVVAAVASSFGLF